MRRVAVQIPQPCPQSRAAMLPGEGGRYCAGCQKTVVDYTTLSDQEIIRRLKQLNTDTGCGRFRDDQLNRPLASAVPPETGWLRWLNLLTMGWIGLQTALAQQPASPATAVPTHVAPARPRFRPIVRSGGLFAPTYDVPLTVSGRVLLYDTADIVRPVANAYVTISRYTDSWYTKTDSTGAFTLPVKTLNQPTTFHISVSAPQRLRSFCQLQTTGTETAIQLTDTALAVYPSRPMVNVTGGGIAILPMPSRWQRFWRGLLHHRPRQNS